MQIHSKAKVDFYKTYLERYVSILCQSKYIHHIRIYDVFCGMGIYEDGGKGSPVVAYETIKSIYETHKITNNTEITLVVNDKSEARLPETTGNLFAEEFALEVKNENANRLKTLLEKALRSPRTNNEIYELVVRHDFLPKHANEVLRELQQNNPHFSVTSIDKGKKARKNSFYLSYNQQGSEHGVGN